MWQVVTRAEGNETAGKPTSWAEAHAAYETAAVKINAVNKKGEYIHPDVRISLRKV